MGLPVLSTLLELAKEPLDRLIVDKNAKAKFEHELAVAAMNAGIAQLEINKTEAQHPSIFVAGWRPFVGWVCAAALAWHFMLYDIFVWIQLVFWPDITTPPQLNGTETLITVLLSMLGLGGLRTFEKLNGVDRQRVRPSKSAGHQ